MDNAELFSSSVIIQNVLFCRSGGELRRSIKEWGELTHDVHVHTDWTAKKKPSVFLSLVIQAYQTLSPQTRDFSILRWPSDVRVRLTCALIKKNKILPSDKRLKPFNTQSVMVRITVVLKASLKAFFFFCLWNKIKGDEHFLDGAVVIDKILYIMNVFNAGLKENDLQIHWCWLAETCDCVCVVLWMQAGFIWQHSSVVLACPLSCGLNRQQTGEGHALHTSWVSWKNCRETQGRREIRETGVREAKKIIPSSACEQSAAAWIRFLWHSNVTG